MMTDKEDQGSHQSVSPEMVVVDHIWLAACDSVKEVKHGDTNIKKNLLKKFAPEANPPKKKQTTKTTTTKNNKEHKINSEASECKQNLRPHSFDYQTPKNNKPN